MKTKQYVAFLQTRRTHPVRVTPPKNSRLGKITMPVVVIDKMTCMVEAANPKDARAKLRNMFDLACRSDEDMHGTAEVSLLHMMEISRVPARGLVLHHEEVFEFPSFRYPIIPQRGTKEIQLGESDEVLWSRKTTGFRFMSSEEIDAELKRIGVHQVLAQYGRCRIAPGFTVADYVKIGEFYRDAGRRCRPQSL